MPKKEKEVVTITMVNDKEIVIKSELDLVNTAIWQTLKDIHYFRADFEDKS